MWIKLKSFANIYNGNSINEDEKRKKYTNVQGRDFIATKDVGFDRTIAYNNGIYIPYGLDNFKVAPANKILMCIEGGSAGRKIAITAKDVCFGNKLACFDSMIVNDLYLFNIFQSNEFTSIFKSALTGIIGGVSINTLKDFIIPLPPLEEQQRIVDKINSFEPLLQEYESYEKKLTELEDGFAEKLKKSILQYAIEGKLIKQDPNDEPASVLLERIKAEKEKLIKEGKIKRDKNESYIYQGDDKNYYEQIDKNTNKINIPFIIPNSWRWAKSKMILRNIQYGYNGAGLQNGIYKLLRITDIQNNIVNWDNVPFCNITSKMATEYQIYKNDIFIARTGGTIGKSFILQEEMNNVVFAGYLIRFQLIDQRQSLYIANYLRSPLYWTQVVDKSAGTGQPNINGVSLGNLLIPIPPITEQYRILEKLEKFKKILNY